MSAFKNPPEFLKKYTENIWLLDYVIEKSQDMTKPITVNQFCRNFRASRVSATLETTIIRRFKTVCYRIHELDELDNDTKVRAMFFMSVPINPGFLEELKKEATVVLNRYNQIIEYTKKDGSLKLNATQAPQSPQTPEPEKHDEWIDRMMEFLAQKTKKSCVPMIFPELDKAFRKASGFSKSTKSAHRLLQIVKEQIFASNEYNLKTRVKMMYISMTSVTGSVLEELRKNAIVEVNDIQQIKYYKAYDGSLELPTPPPIAIVPAPEVYAMTSSGRRVRQLAPSRVVSSASTPSRPAVSKRSSAASENFVSKKPRREKSDQQNENIPAEDTADTHETDEEDDDDDDDQGVPIRVVYNTSADFQPEEERPSNSTATAGHDDNRTDFSDFSPIPDTNTQSTSSAFYTRPVERRDFPDSGISQELKKKESAMRMRYTKRFLATTPRNITVKTEIPDNEDVLCDTTFVPVNNTADSSSLSFTASNSTQNMTDSRTYLVKLRGLVLSLESPLFDDLKQDFTAKLEEFKRKTIRVSNSNILCMLNTTYMIAMQHSRAPNPDYPEDQFMSLKKFLHSLYMHVVIIECHELEAKIAEARQNAADLVVPVDRIRDSLATLIYVATSKL